MVVNEFCKVARYAANVSRDQGAPILGSDLKKFRIGVPSGITPAAARKSIEGSRRRKPLPIAGFKSASA